MKYNVFIDPEREEEVIIYAHSKTKIVEKIEEILSSENSEFFGYGEGNVVKLDLNDVICFTAEEGKVFAHTKNEKLYVKLRLYQLEELFSADFIKINQSCLVRVDKIKRFSSSIGGSLMVTLEGGYRDYVSRRQLKTVKERIGF
ncbi:MAG: LytTR family transcriptional regulator [Clostridia bacterium]|nr:LytTR family transcriptional regulator [Clostridia bacterium]